MTTTSSGTLTARRVQSEADIQTMRLIRNECREGFAHFNGIISESEQRAWWDIEQGRVTAWLYEDEVQFWPHGRTPRVVGFGMLRRGHDGQLYTTCAIYPWCTGNNYGKAIMRHMSAQTAERLVGEARRDNPAACKLHHIEGWHLDHETERLAVYTRPEVSGG